MRMSIKNWTATRIIECMSTRWTVYQNTSTIEHGHVGGASVDFWLDMTALQTLRLCAVASSFSAFWLPLINTSDKWQWLRGKEGGVAKNVLRHVNSKSLLL